MAKTRGSIAWRSPEPRGRAIVSVNNDWKTVSLFDNRGPPGDVNTGEGNRG